MSKRAEFENALQGDDRFFSFMGDTTVIEKIADPSASDRTFSGWLTTESVDFSNHILRAASFKDNWELYSRNPIYCWSHDWKTPIGTVGNPELVLSGETKGVYLRNVKILSDDVLPAARYFFGAIKEGVVKQQSAGFGVTEKKVVRTNGKSYLELLKSILFEGSAAPIAMNPTCIIDEKALKSLFSEMEGKGLMMTVEEVGKALLQPEWAERIPSAPVHVFMPQMSFKTFEPVVDEQEPEESPKTQTKEQMPTVNISLGVAVKAVPPIHIDYAALKELLFATTKDAKGVFPIGGLDAEDTPVYDSSMMLKSLAAVLGARNSANLDPETRFAAVAKICGQMRSNGLSTSIPVAKELKVDKLSQEALAEVRYADVVWEGETSFKLHEVLLGDALNDVSNLFTKLNSHSPSSAFEIFAKWAYTSTSLYIIPEGESESKLLEEVQAAYSAYLARKNEGEAPSDEIEDDVIKAKDQTEETVPATVPATTAADLDEKARQSDVNMFDALIAILKE